MPSGFHTWSQTSASNATADSAIGWSEGQAPSSVNDSARAEMAVLAKWRDDNNGSITTGGTSTALTVTSNTVFTTLALMDKQTIAFTMGTTSGAAPTLNVDGLGAKSLRNSTGVTLPTGALLSGSVVHATYFNTAGEWLLHNQPAVLPTNSVVTASITDANVTTAKIADDAVTYAKLQNVSATSRLLGRATAGAGDAEELTVGGGLSFSGSSIISAAAAAQSDQETATSTTTFVSPGRQQYHPGSAKAWARITSAGAISEGYNVTSASNTGTGAYTLTFTVPFSSTTYAAFGMGETNVVVYANSKTTSVLTYSVVIPNTGAGSNQAHQIVCFGDQ